MTSPVDFAKKLTFWRKETSTWEKVGGITELPDLPSVTRKSIDVTTVEDDFTKRVGGTTKDAGSITINVLDHHDSDVMQDLKADIGRDLPIEYRIQLSSGRHWDFFGIVTSVKPSSKNDDVIRTAITIEISGEPDESATAPTS